jgi:hypothetical protein
MAEAGAASSDPVKGEAGRRDDRGPAVRPHSHAWASGSETAASVAETAPEVPAAPIAAVVAAEAADEIFPAAAVAGIRDSSPP